MGFCSRWKFPTLGMTVLSGPRLLNVPVNNFSVMSGRSHRFLDFNQYSRELMCLAQGHNTVTLVEIEPRTSRFGVRRSTTRPPRSLRDSVTFFIPRHLKKCGILCYTLQKCVRVSVRASVRPSALRFRALS